MASDFGVVFTCIKTVAATTSSIDYQRLRVEIIELRDCFSPYLLVLLSIYLSVYY